MPSCRYKFAELAVFLASYLLKLFQHLSEQQNICADKAVHIKRVYVL